MKMTKNYWAIWRCSGTAQVSEKRKGSYLIETDDIKEIADLYEYCADNCDDCEICEVIATSPGVQDELKYLWAEQKAKKEQFQSQEYEEAYDSGRPE